MWRLDRDRIWFFAWGCVPLALAVNLFAGFGAERAALLSQQASVDAVSKEWQRSAERFAEAARFDPGSALMAYNAAASYLQSGNLDEAARWNDEALRRDPELAEALRARRVLRTLRARGLSDGVQRAGKSAPGPTSGPPPR